MKVKIKTWKQMEEEFGLDMEGNTACEIVFTSGMEKRLPKDRIIETYIDANGNKRWKRPNLYPYFISNGIIESFIDEPEKKDLISEMKENKILYGLLDHDRQAILNKAGCENSLYYRAVANIWGQVTGKKFCEGSVYRLKPDYQPKEESKYDKNFIEKCKSCTHTIKTPDGEITLQPVFHSIAWSVLFMGFGIKFNNTTSGESSCFVLDRDEATELMDALTTAIDGMQNIEIAGNGNGKEENK